MFKKNGFLLSSEPVLLLIAETTSIKIESGIIATPLPLNIFSHIARASS